MNESYKTVAELRASQPIDNKKQNRNHNRKYEDYRERRRRHLLDFYTGVYINRFTYDNVDPSFNAYTMEQAFLSGAIGVAVGMYEGQIRVLGTIQTPKGGISQNLTPTMTNGLLQIGTDMQSVIPQADFNKLTQINPLYPDEGDYTIVVNKDSNIYGASTYTDMSAIELYADELSEIDTIAYKDRSLMQTSLVMAGKKGQIDNAMLVDNYLDGATAIAVDENFQQGAIQPMVMQSNPAIQGTLQTARENKESELLTYLGINNSAIKKKERMVQAEAEANNGIITLASNVSLNPRKRAFDILNERFGTDIQVRFAYDNQTTITGLNAQKEY